METELLIDLEIVNFVFNQSLLKNRIFLFFIQNKATKMLGEPRVRKTTRAYDYSSVLRTRRFYAGVALRTSRLAHAWFNR